MVKPAAYIRVVSYFVISFVLRDILFMLLLATISLRSIHLHIKEDESSYK